MLKTLSTAASGMAAQELRIDVISNNIANINTTAYKRQRAGFQDLLYQQHRAAGPASADTDKAVPTGVNLGLGVKTGGVYSIPEQGELTQTSSELDLAIQGRGYFRAELPDGTYAYTRDGSFQKNADGQIVTGSKGYLITPGISLPQDTTSITINDVGQVIALTASSTTPQVIGQFDLTDFINTAGLEPIGDNLFKETTASGAPIIGVAGSDQFGTILQTWLEISNVNPVVEIAELIAAQRAYELNSKVIQAGDDMLRAINETA